MSRLGGLIARGILRLVSDEYKRQTAQVTLRSGEVRDDAERWQQYGLTSHPLTGAECLYLRIGSEDGSDGVVIDVEDRRYRLKSLAAGEVALYDDLGQRVHLTRTGINITTTGTATITAAKVVLSTPDVRLGSASASTGVVCAGNPMHICPVMPFVGHLVGSTKVKAD